MPSTRLPTSGPVNQSFGLARPTEPPKVLYVNKVGSDGWLQALADGSNERISLFKYAKVSDVQSRAGRTYFRVMEGAAKGRVLSLTDANAREHLGTTGPKNSPAHINVTYGKYEESWYSKARNERLPQQMAVLDIAGVKATVTMNTVWGTGFFPLPPGTYTVLLPYAPHDRNMTRFYRRVEPQLTFDQVWFPILYGNNSRYVHIGNVSDGCVTVMDFVRWSAIHEALLSHRTVDGRGVALLTVKGRPERDR